jgi:hypothetical protein
VLTSKFKYWGEEKLDPSGSLPNASPITYLMPTILRLNPGIISKTLEFNHLTCDNELKIGAIRNVNSNTCISITNNVSFKDVSLQWLIEISI